MMVTILEHRSREHLASATAQTKTSAADWLPEVPTFRRLSACPWPS
jgi:hypothetical protein